MNHPYLPLTDEKRGEMLRSIGVNTLEDLLVDIPENLRLGRPLNLPAAKAEPELKKEIVRLAGRNKQPQLSFLGAGAYEHYIPAAIDHLAGRSEFYTAYTPYQPEISQGMLQAIFEYQTYIAELFGLPYANASLYDGATALAEAVLMAVKESKKLRVLLPETFNPFYEQVLLTYAQSSSIEPVRISGGDGVIDRDELVRELKEPVAAVVIQNPNFYGVLEDLPELIKIVKAAGAVPICVVHPLTLGLLESPGKLGAEIVVGEGQPLGLPVSFGGPYLGLMAVSERFLRRIPGRLVGQTADHHGKRAFVLTLQTREQHIRREKATSNICSNQALCAFRAAVYLSLIGPSGIKLVAERCFQNAHYLGSRLAEIGFPPLFGKEYFMEFAVKTPRPAGFYLERLLAKGILGGFDIGRVKPTMPSALLISATETKTKEELDLFVAEMELLR